MRQDRIVEDLKTYQHCKNPHLLKGLTEGFVTGINPRILKNHGRCAECAVRKVLAAMFALPARPLLCLEAMVQLCRDDPFEFNEWQDEDIICRINMRHYFTSFTAEQMVVETQEGVV